MSPYVEIFLRSIGAFILILLVTRLLGKSQVNQLTVADFINAIVIGAIAGSLVVELGESGYYYAFGLLVFGLLTIGAEYIALKYRPARKLMEGEPTVVIHNGKILEDNMKKLLYNTDNLTMQLREQGIFNIADVEFAVAEPNGSLSVLPKADKLPPTASDMNIPVSYQGIPSELIQDGKIIEQNLLQNNLDEEWLFRELEKQGITAVSDVNFASLDSDGNLYVDLKRDKIDHLTDPTDKVPKQKRRKHRMDG